MIQNLNGSGDLVNAQPGTDIKNINGQSILGPGNLELPAKRYIHYGMCQGRDASTFRIQWQFISNNNVVPENYTASGILGYFLANGWNLGEHVPVNGHVAGYQVFSI